MVETENDLLKKQPLHVDDATLTIPALRIDGPIQTIGRASNTMKPTDNKERRKKLGGTGLNDFFIGIFGVAFLVSLSLNILHITGHLNHELDSAIHQSIKDFKTFDLSKTKRGAGPREPKGFEDGTNRNFRLAQLNCDAFGGPPEEFAQEMVYWQDIPDDSTWVSPFKDPSETKYLTFEPDGGGWNNIRMAMETVFALALAMGRTLVIPPEKSMYLLGKQDNKQKKHFSFIDFYPIDDIAGEYIGLNIVSSKSSLHEENSTLEKRS